MERHKTVEAYIEANADRRDELNLLREILRDTELIEEVKWGAPCYTVDKKNVIGIGAFKSYIGLWFHQGVFLKDPKKVLINAQEGTTKGLRQWRFESLQDIDRDLVKAYVLEAIENQKAGKMIKAESKQVDLPVELESALSKDKELKMQFEALSPYKQKEYKEHIGSAKQEKTRISRLEKSIPLILEGKGLNDKYR